MSKQITMKRANKLMKVDESKLDVYLRYYNNEILFEPDDTQPNAEVLTDTQRDQLIKYKRVFALLDIGRPENMIRSLLNKEYGIEDRQARNIIQESYIIYGSVGVADLEGRRRASINYQRMLSNLAFSKGDYKAASDISKTADTLEKLFQEDYAGLDPEAFRKPSQVIFTNNINVLNNRRKELDPDD